MTRPKKTNIPYTTLFRSAHPASGIAPGTVRIRRRLYLLRGRSGGGHHHDRDGVRERPVGGGVGRLDARSEEHTSELQSHVNIVCRLLLEIIKRCKEYSKW